MAKALLSSFFLGIFIASPLLNATESSPETIADLTIAPLTQTECETSVSNIQKSIKKHKLNLRKQKARSLSNIEKNVIRTALAELNSKVSVENCLSSEGKFQEGYRCMLVKSDIQDCKMNSAKDN